MMICSYVICCLRARGNTLNLDGIFGPLTEAGMIMGTSSDLKTGEAVPDKGRNIVGACDAADSEEYEEIRRHAVF